MDLNNRRKYLSISFACSCISNTSSFVFSNWSVKSRHPDTLLFNDHITPKTDSFKFTFAANFPRMWAELPDSVRDSFILYSKSSFKNILKVTLLKLVMLSWSWTPNLFYCYLSLLPASTLILSTCLLGLWLGGLVGWAGGWLCFLWFVGLGLVVLQHDEMVF